jgi:hypothetical protein
VARLLRESPADGLLLEDGSGVLLLEEDDSAEALVSQFAVEVASASHGESGVSQVAAEVASNTHATGLISAFSVEFVNGAPAEVWMSQLVVEVAYRPRFPWYPPAGVPCIPFVQSPVVPGQGDGF